MRGLQGLAVLLLWASAAQAERPVTSVNVV